jgi:hypothetical protein
MNVHSLLDVLSIALAVVPTGRARFFRDGVESPTLPDLTGSIRLDVAPISGEGRYEVPARLGTARLDPAFEVARWRGAGYPTLLFHHGNNERPFDRGSFGKILGLCWGWIAYHTGSIRWTVVSHVLLDFAGLGALVYFR